MSFAGNDLWRRRVLRESYSLNRCDRNFALFEDNLGDTVERGGVTKAFSSRTLGEFEAASASIPIRPLDRVFEAAHIRLGKDPGGLDGARRVQFRRYVASVDQNDPQQLKRLGDALGALIDEVAISKQDFLVQAAERDGFVFADGVFRAASPKDAIAGAKVQLDAACRSLLRLAGEPAPAKTAGLAEVVKATLKTLDR
jgi:hypothetical protein